jgi:hypothetical protein
MTDQATRVTPAGWYEDPADDTHVRWWNGVAWTEHTELKPSLEATSAATVVVADPVPEPATEPEPQAVRTTEPEAARPLTRREAIAAEGGRQAPDAARSATGTVWLIALLPVIAFVIGIVALYVVAYLAPSFWVVLAALLPYLLGLLWAISDSRQLAARGFRAPRPLWALLTPLGYLIARRLRVPGTGPLVLFAITTVLAVAAPLVFWFSGASAIVTVPARVQHAVQTQFVDTGRLRSVSCPPLIGSLSPGTLFTCDAVAKTGVPTEVWVSIDSPDGGFSIAPSITHGAS